MINIKFQLKIWLSLGVSYLLIMSLSDVFFIGKSPVLRLHPEQYLAKKFQTQVDGVLISLNFKKPVNTQNSITAEDFKNFMSTAAAKGMQQVTTGTYAANINGEDVRIIKLGEKLMDNCTYSTPQGQKIIHVLKGKPCPSEADVADLLR